MKSNRLWTALLVALAVILSAGVANAEKAREERDPSLFGCSIQGTWYGYNEAGEVFVITITRTGAKTYSAVGLSPNDPSAFPGAFESNSTQGDLTRTGPGEFDSSWMAFSVLDPLVWGFELGNTTATGPITMTSCDSWEATFKLEVLGFNFGQDAFEDGNLLFALEFSAFYRRLPELPQ